MNRHTIPAMVGRLVAKDFMMGARYLWVVIPFFLAYGALFFALTGIYFIVSGIFIFSTAAGVLLLEYLHKSEALLSSLPLKRSAIVMGRYATSGFIIAAGVVLCYAYGVFLSRIIPQARSGFDPADVFPGLSPFVLATAASLALFLPFHFRYGPAKGFAVFSAAVTGFLLTAAVVGAVAWSAANGTLEGYSVSRLVERTARWYAGMKALAVTIAAVSATGGIVVVSIRLSLRFYAHRDIS